jgi:putative transcriptional regulator
LRTEKVRGLRFDTLSKICLVLECQPGDILEYQVDPNDLNATEN